MSHHPLFKHHLFAAPSHHHVMSQSTENREEAIQSALEDIREEIYSNVAKTVVAFEISVRLLQRRVQRSESRFDRSAINKALNEAQEETLFQYIERLDRIEMSSTSEMIRSNVNYLLKLNDARENRRIDLNWITRFQQRNLMLFKRKQKSFAVERKKLITKKNWCFIFVAFVRLAKNRTCHKWYHEEMSWLMSSIIEQKHRESSRSENSSVFRSRAFF